MSYFHETIWKGVPKFLRRVDTALKNIGIDERVPYNAPLIQFSSWMGGDRDGMILLSVKSFRSLAICCLSKGAFGSSVGDEIFKLELVDFSKTSYNIFLTFQKKTKTEMKNLSWSCNTKHKLKLLNSSVVAPGKVLSLSLSFGALAFSIIHSFCSRCR